MLPDPDYVPPEISKMRVRLPVPFDIARELRRPPRGVAFRDGLVIGAPVPEASVHEHSDLLPGKQDIGAPAREARQNGIDAIAKTARVQDPPQGPLGFRVSRALTGHPQ